MKENFFISVSNGILEDTHFEKMGASIWQFLWCLDKVTKIDNEGVGLVLGGKPIQLKDVVGGHRVTVSRRLTHLEKEGYIKLTHTPYGIVIRVMKVKKRFNKIAKPQAKRINKSAKEGLAKTLNPLDKSAKPVCENAKPNKTVTIDNTEDNNRVTERGDTPKEKAEKFFEGVLVLVNGGKVEWLQEMLSKIAEKSPASKKQIWAEVRKFCDYWTERNSTGTRELWQLQKTFEVDKRLATWFRRAGIEDQKSQKFQAPKKGREIIGLRYKNGN